MTDKEIIDLYVTNQWQISKIIRECNITRRYIENVLSNNKIKIRGGRHKKILTDSDIQKVKDLYVNTLTPIRQIAKEVNADQTVVKRIIKECELQKRTSKRINAGLISDYFETIDNPHKAYWLGMLFTDGSVDRNRGHYRIRLTLQYKDKELLEKFQHDLGLQSKLYERKEPGKESFSVEFNDEKMFNDLSKYGICPRKTYVTEHIPKNIPNEYIVDFIRGMFDGDGCLTYSDDMVYDVVVNFTSYHKQIIDEFKLLVDEYVLDKQNHNKSFFTTAWHTQWRGYNQVVTLLDKLYDNADIYLERKYNKYIQLKNRK